MRELQGTLGRQVSRGSLPNLSADQNFAPLQPGVIPRQSLPCVTEEPGVQLVEGGLGGTNESLSRKSSKLTVSRRASSNLSANGRQQSNGNLEEKETKNTPSREGSVRSLKKERRRSSSKELEISVEKGEEGGVGGVEGEEEEGEDALVRDCIRQHMRSAGFNDRDIGNTQWSSRRHLNTPSGSIDFQRAIQVGLNSESFDLVNNIRLGDSREGVKDADMLLYIMQKRNCTFDEARLALIRLRMEAAGIDPETGMTRDAKAVHSLSDVRVVPGKTAASDTTLTSHAQTHSFSQSTQAPASWWRGGGSSHEMEDKNRKLAGHPNRMLATTKAATIANIHAAASNSHTTSFPTLATQMGVTPKKKSATNLERKEQGVCVPRSVPDGVTGVGASANSTPDVRQATRPTPYAGTSTNPIVSAASTPATNVISTTTLNYERGSKQNCKENSSTCVPLVVVEAVTSTSNPTVNSTNSISVSSTINPPVPVNSATTTPSHDCLSEPKPDNDTLKPPSCSNSFVEREPSVDFTAEELEAFQRAQLLAAGIDPDTGLLKDAKAIHGLSGIRGPNGPSLGVNRVGSAPESTDDSENLTVRQVASLPNNSDQAEKKKGGGWLSRLWSRKSTNDAPQSGRSGQQMGTVRAVTSPEQLMARTGPPKETEPLLPTALPPAVSKEGKPNLYTLVAYDSSSLQQSYSTISEPSAAQLRSSSEASLQAITNAI